MKQVSIVASFIAVVAGNAWCLDQPSLDRGRELFESEQLGTVGKSCASCHPGGRKLEWAATGSDEKLAATINRCITGALKGKRLDPAGPDMASLLLYIRSFAGIGR
jgi:hypothetical protein